MKLTDEQDEVLSKLLEFVISDEKEIILQGRAGTGKTYLLSALKEQYEHLKLSGLPDVAFIFCATTHKAVEALKERGIYAHTLHKTLGINIHDQLTTQPLPPRMKTVLIVDECSYINYDQLKCIRQFPIKVIYVGDKNQLTPVGLNHSPVYYSDIPMVELKTVIRQQSTSSIAHYCDLLVDSIENHKAIPEIMYGDDIIYLDKSDFDKAVKQLYPFNPNKRILGLTNSTIQRFNNKVDGEIRVGDVLVNNTSGYHIPNNALVTVVSVLPKQDPHIQELRVNYQGNIHLVEVPLTTEARKSKFRNQYDLRKPYAQTIHKAQGSTYEEVYLYLTDFRHTRSLEDVKRLLYVAFSRATSKVYVTGALK